MRLGADIKGFEGLEQAFRDNAASFKVIQPLSKSTWICLGVGGWSETMAIFWTKDSRLALQNLAVAEILQQLNAVDNTQGCKCLLLWSICMHPCL